MDGDSLAGVDARDEHDEVVALAADDDLDRAPAGRRRAGTRAPRSRRRPRRRARTARRGRRPAPAPCTARPPRAAPGRARPRRAAAGRAARRRRAAPAAPGAARPAGPRRRVRNSCSAAGVQVPEQAQPQGERRDPQRRAVVQLALQVPAGRPAARRAVRRRRATSSPGRAAARGRGSCRESGGSQPTGHRGSPPGGGRVIPTPIVRQSVSNASSHVNRLITVGLGISIQPLVLDNIRGSEGGDDRVGRRGCVQPGGGPRHDLRRGGGRARIADGDVHPRRPHRGHAGGGLRPRRRLPRHRRGRQPPGGEQPGPGRPRVQAPPRRPHTR